MPIPAGRISNRSRSNCVADARRSEHSSQGMRYLPSCVSLLLLAMSALLIYPDSDIVASNHVLLIFMVGNTYGITENLFFTAEG